MRIPNCEFSVGAALRRCLTERFGGSMLVMTLTVFALVLAPAAVATAQSQRCPSDSLGIGIATLYERLTIGKISSDLHGAAYGGDGPLGCPVGDPVLDTPGKHSWTGVMQRFQRGWILIGRGSSAGSEIAFVRGLGSWTIWWRGLPDKVLPTVYGTSTGSFKAAAWPRGGSIFITDSTDVVSLLRCPVNQAYSASQSISAFGCTHLTPELYAPERPFDAAAHLDPYLLTTPDTKAYDKRVGALFPNWLPCYLQPPVGVGESTIVHAMIMMRRSTPCPLTSRAPSDDVKQWLLTLQIPDGMLPGTNSSDSDCPRTGELDVTLVQLLSLVLRNRVALQGPVFDHVKAVLDPWGTTARKNPYITPDESDAHLCFGFMMIESENHMLLQETAAYLINALTERDTTGNRDWILGFLNQIARRDFYEFNSIPYSRYHLKALYALHDYAPDARVKTVAKGVLNWVFAKQAVSGNLDRDHRPYRRSHAPEHLVPADWWGSAATPIATETAVLAGPLQHAHSDIDLQFDKGLDDDQKAVLTNVTGYPDLGAAPGYAGAALVDTANTGYRLPEALVGWLERRFTSEESNRTTYLQAINHVPKIPDDRQLFAQANNGTEVVSGNRNWTMIGGGTPAPPGDPGTPPVTGLSETAYTLGGVVGGALIGAAVGSAAGPIGTAIGAVFGAIIGGFLGNQSPKDIAESKQRTKLWETQAGTIRETTFIPTAGGLDRTQTIRFGTSIVTTEDGQIPRLCVAEGFMCGYDLTPPRRPFPTKDALNCHGWDEYPAALTSAFQARVGPGQTITTILGCPTKAVGFQDHGEWSIWTFDTGMLAIGRFDDPGKERFAAAWVERPSPESRGRLRVAWDIRGDGYDWFRVHAYERSVLATGGEPPGGWIDPLPIVGNPDDRTEEATGDATFDLEKVGAPSLEVLIVGCSEDYFLGVATGHDCFDDKMPKLSVSVGPQPKQSFSCAVHPPSTPLTHMVRPSEGIVMEVGSCKGGPFGLFVYVWSQACQATRLEVNRGGNSRLCPGDAKDYGFVVAAPSRGMTPDQFRNIVEGAMVSWRAGGQDYFPGTPGSIDVPISPPVALVAGGWKPSAPPSKHAVSFQWPFVNGTAILGDTGAPNLFDPAALGAPFKDWPTALGHVSAPDIAAASNTLIRSVGSGCFTVAGFPTPSDPDPMGLFVDFRDLAAPIVTDRLTSALPTLCF